MSPAGPDSRGAGDPESTDGGGKARPGRWVLFGFAAGLIAGFVVTLLYLMIR